ncbi:hypothetical protein Goari_016133, partial [Gossypium aridum]|nr:hypothetical protein [Gossypium aridum]
METLGCLSLHYLWRRYLASPKLLILETSLESCFPSSNANLSFSLIFASLQIHDIGIETMTLDKSWVDAFRFSMVYMNGIASFIEYATGNCTNSYTYIFRARSALIKFSVSKLYMIIFVHMAIGLNVPVHDKDEFSQGDHVNGRGGIDSTLLPSEDVRRTTDEVINLMDD